MSDHVHDENCSSEHEHEEQVFLIADDDGNELEMVIVYTFETENQLYAVLLDRNNLEADGVIFRIEDEDGESFLASIEDDAEWDRAAAIYQQIAEEEGKEEDESES